jgi:site-specific DNA recombinase
MRVVSYSRVSKGEQVEGYSLDAQRERIRRHCAENNHQIVAQVADEGISARYESVAKRPALMDALRMVESGQSDAIAVHKLDRLARNLRVFQEVLDRTNNRVIFVEERIDPTTAAGEMMANMMATIAQFFSRNLANEVQKGIEGRRKEGLHPGGPIPFGLRKDQCNSDGRKAVLVADTAPTVTDADGRRWSRYDALLHIFNRVAEGRSAIKISNELREIGFELTPPGVRHIVQNRVYLGEIPAGHRKGSPYATEYLPGLHEGIVPEYLWHAANDAYTSKPCMKRINSVRREAQIWSCTGLLMCGRCGGAMHVKQHRAGARAECYTRYKTQQCDQPSFKLEKLQPQILEVLAGYAIPEEIIVQLERGGGEQRRDIKAEIRTLEGRKKRVTNSYIDGQISREEMNEKNGAIDRELASLREIEGKGSDLIEFGRYLRSIPDLYLAATEEERNEILRGFIEKMVVDDRTINAVRPRPEVARLLGRVHDVETKLARNRL